MLSHVIPLKCGLHTTPFLLSSTLSRSPVPWSGVRFRKGIRSSRCTFTTTATLEYRLGSMSGTNDDSIKLYKQLAELPSYKAGQFQASNVLRVTTVASDHERLAKRTSIKTYFVTGEQTFISVSPDVPEIVASSLSPSGKYLAVLREVNDSAAPDGKKRFVEIWAEDTIQATQEVTNIHGAFFTDEYLSSISFSPSELKVVYTAEAKPDEPASDPLAKYRFTPDFGESFGGKKRPSVFLFDWKSEGKPKVSKLILPDTSGPTLLGHPIFGGEDQIFAVSYDYTEDHRLLGILVCPNRQTAIWRLSLPSDRDVEEQKDSEVPVSKCTTISRLTPTDSSVRSPRVLYGADGRASHLLWLSNAVGGPHMTCSTLQILDLSSGETNALVKSVWDAKPSEFPGLYLNTLPSSPFITLNANDESKRFVALSSGWGSRSVILLIALEDGKIINLTPDNEDVPYSWTVLGTDGKTQILATRSAPNRPHELGLGTVNVDGTASWTIVEKPNIPKDLLEKLEELKTEIIPIPGREPTETVVVRKPTQGTQPSITIPHGGPHGTIVARFDPTSTALAIEGYTISYPNYTGSLNFGEKHVNALLGKIGSLDVEDCISSIKHLVSIGYTAEGSGQQYLHGTSHGGFLTGHLIGQYPKEFSGAILRNPVISVGELSYSDIPDWYFEESGLRYTPTSLVTPEVYQKMWSMSPIAHVDNVECPVILLIGDKDQRVATTQGKGYYHALKGRGKDVQMLTFKDDIHPIDSVEGSLAAYQAALELFGRARRN